MSLKQNEKYSIRYNTPEGEVHTTFITKQAFMVHQAHVIERYGKKAIIEQSGPDLKSSTSEKLILNEAH